MRVAAASLTGSVPAMQVFVISTWLPSSQVSFAVGERCIRAHAVFFSSSRRSLTRSTLTSLPADCSCVTWSGHVAGEC